jgi:hypothetical protein
MIHEIQCDSPAGRAEFADANRTQIEQKGLRAWDYGRMISVTRWSLSAGFMDEREAWHWLIRAGKSIKRWYNSWEEYGTGWSLGYEYWNDGRGVDREFLRQLNWLNSDARSPWNEVGWDVEIPTESSPFQL